MQGESGRGGRMGRERGLDKSPSSQEEGNNREAASISVHDAYGPPPSKSGPEAASSPPVKEGCTPPAKPLEVSAMQGEMRTAGRYVNGEVKSTVSCMQVSAKGLQVIQHHEGLRLQPYTDTGGRQAIGYGHHIRDGENYSCGISKERANRLLVKDLKVARFHVADKVAVPLNQGQYDALVSFVYNVGSENFARSTLLRKLNSGDYTGAANEFHKWNRAGNPGKVMRGLTNRREAEKALFQNL